jgi:5-methylcytosine-specific restriction endonuclease McrA
VDPLVVFMVQQWMCQECGRETPSHLRGTYDELAPELDHIMPLAAGGEHSYANVQTLCRRCNALKGASYYIASDEIKNFRGRSAGGNDEISSHPAGSVAQSNFPKTRP